MDAKLICQTVGVALTHGGEFITQLWALLTDAGIVEQHKEKQDV
jgi:hypothetical protein